MKSGLVDFMKSNYIGPRIAVAGTGAVSTDALVRHLGMTPFCIHR
jgi:hypothetical protein